MESRRTGVDEVLCMKGGTDKNSYTRNSLLQKTVIGTTRSLLEESIKGLCFTTLPECLNIADLGCSSGPNALAVLRSIIDITASTCQSWGLGIPEFNVLMNDLPQNDFNTIFKLLPSFYKTIEEEKGVEIACFISGTPGSFYGRLFPRNSIHFIHSSYSLHWLSQAPEGLGGKNGKEAVNKGCVCANIASPPRALQAYRDQFAKDFTMFLRCRSEEIVHGGRVVLTFAATQGDPLSVVMESMSQALNQLASEGLIDKEKMDAFNLPYYRPEVEQVKELIEAEGSFILHKFDTFGLPWDVPTREEGVEDKNNNRDIDPSRVSTFITSTTRVVFEALLASEFGEDIMDDVFRLFEDTVRSELANGSKMGVLNVVVSLIRKDLKNVC